MKGHPHHPNTEQKGEKKTKLNQRALKNPIELNPFQDREISLENELKRTFRVRADDDGAPGSRGEEWGFWDGIFLDKPKRNRVGFCNNPNRSKI
uniref:Uncharacterized protein n=1 Tax=Cucumis melo TaxID=3656 RepID=A0A9I9DBF7_CUCME